ncbi:TetR/AcrR family transcriptional regulator [Nocardioides sp. SYSU DS0651]|uniref:TetR/AcrR family transcriptional regulator n=1 Tax=Nocardioides sp. SYSU DS0651 TaxID=3415955 RepID=UPI003F4C070F
MARDTRSRMVIGAARMVGTRGPGGTSLRELAKEAGVPLGSTYHHFPGGKRQLVDESVRFLGDHVARIIDSSREGGVEAALDALVAQWRRVLEDSGFRTGCAVLAVATEDDPELRQTATDVFAMWQEHLVAVLVAAGTDPARAPRLARTVVAAVEGAVALCRAERSVAPLEDVSQELRLLLEAAR